MTFFLQDTLYVMCRVGEWIENKKILGEKQEAKIWTSLQEEGMFAKIFAESWRLFEFPFDDEKYGPIIEDMKTYGVLIDYRVQYLKYALPFLPVLFIVAIFDGLMMREVAKKTYSFSSPFVHNLAINYMLFPSIFFSILFLFLPFSTNIVYTVGLYLVATVGIWFGVSHMPKRF